MNPAQRLHAQLLTRSLGVTLPDTLPAHVRRTNRQLSITHTVKPHIIAIAYAKNGGNTPPATMPAGRV